MSQNIVPISLASIVSRSNTPSLQIVVTFVPNRETFHLILSRHSCSLVGSKLFSIGNSQPITLAILLIQKQVPMPGILYVQWERYPCQQAVTVAVKQVAWRILKT